MSDAALIYFDNNAKRQRIPDKSGNAPIREKGTDENRRTEL